MYFSFNLQYPWGFFITKPIYLPSLFYLSGDEFLLVKLWNLQAFKPRGVTLRKSLKSIIFYSQSVRASVPWKLELNLETEKISWIFLVSKSGRHPVFVLSLLLAQTTLLKYVGSSIVWWLVTVLPLGCLL